MPDPTDPPVPPEGRAAPTEGELRAFVAGWRLAALGGFTDYSHGDWIAARRAPVDDYPFDSRSLRAVFRHFTDRRYDARRDDAEKVFVFAAKTVLGGSESDWKKIQTLAGQLDTITDRRSAAIEWVSYAIDVLSDARTTEDTRPALTDMLITQLCIIDPAFDNLDSSKVSTWLAEAKPATDKKGGAGNKGAHFVTGILAVSVGALGFDRAEGAKLRPAATTAAKALRKASRGA